MNTLQEKVKTTLQQTAEEIRPHQVPPLRLDGHRLRNAWRTRGHRLSPWLTPLAAAGAVAAVIATAIGISGAIHPARRPVTASTPAAVLAKVPPFFVGLTGGMEGQQRRAEVAATATGKTLATIEPPKPFGAFDWVSAAADDRTFVLGAQIWVPLDHERNVPMVFFKVVLNAAGQPGRLMRLPIRPQGSEEVTGMALSPDGSKLAVAWRRPGSLYPRDPQIRVFDLATGKSRQWVWPGSGWIGVRKPFGQALSWAADSRRLVFQQHVGKGGNDFQVRMLDTTTQPGSLRSARLLIDFPRGTINGPIAGNTLLTPDGSKIVAPTLTTLNRRFVAAVEITEFATSTGEPVRVLDRVPSNKGGYWQEVVWSDAHGETLVLGSVLPGSDDTERPVLLGIFDGHRFLPLPAAAHKFNAEETVW